MRIYRTIDLKAASAHAVLILCFAVFVRPTDAAAQSSPGMEQKERDYLEGLIGPEKKIEHEYGKPSEFGKGGHNSLEGPESQPGAPNTTSDPNKIRLYDDDFNSKHVTLPPGAPVEASKHVTTNFQEQVAKLERSGVAPDDIPWHLTYSPSAAARGNEAVRDFEKKKWEELLAEYKQKQFRKSLLGGMGKEFPDNATGGTQDSAPRPSSQSSVGMPGQSVGGSGNSEPSSSVRGRAVTGRGAQGQMSGQAGAAGEAAAGGGAFGGDSGGSAGTPGASGPAGMSTPGAFDKFWSQSQSNIGGASGQGTAGSTSPGSGQRASPSGTSGATGTGQRQRGASSGASGGASAGSRQSSTAGAGTATTSGQRQGSGVSGGASPDASARSGQSSTADAGAAATSGQRQGNGAAGGTSEHRSVTTLPNGIDGAAGQKSAGVPSGMSGDAPAASAGESSTSGTSAAGAPASASGSTATMSGSAGGSSANTPSTGTTFSSNYGFSRELAMLKGSQSSSSGSVSGSDGGSLSGSSGSMSGSTSESTSDNRETPSTGAASGSASSSSRSAGSPGLIQRLISSIMPSPSPPSVQVASLPSSSQPPTTDVMRSPTQTKPAEEQDNVVKSPTSTAAKAPDLDTGERQPAEAKPTPLTHEDRVAAAKLVEGLLSGTVNPDQLGDKQRDQLRSFVSEAKDTKKVGEYTAATRRMAETNKELLAHNTQVQAENRDGTVQATDIPITPPVGGVINAAGGSAGSGMTIAEGLGGTPYLNGGVAENGINVRESDQLAADNRRTFESPDRTLDLQQLRIAEREQVELAMQSVRRNNQFDILKILFP